MLPSANPNDRNSCGGHTGGAPGKNAGIVQCELCLFRQVNQHFLGSIFLFTSWDKHSYHPLLFGSLNKICEMTSTLPVHHCSPPTPIITFIFPIFCILHQPFVSYSVTSPGFRATVRVQTRARPLVVRPGSATSSALQFWASHLHPLFPFCYLSGGGNGRQLTE